MLYIYLVACVGFVILQGFFAASEISFISSRFFKLRYRYNRGDKRAKRVHDLILKPEKFLATTLIGTNVSLVLSSSLLTFSLIQMGVKESNLWITFIFTPFIVIFAELIPKSIGRFFREDYSCKVVNLIAAFEKIFLPVVEVSERASRFLVKAVVKKYRRRSPYVTKEEIKLLIREIEKKGDIDRGEKRAIEEVFEFGSDRIKDFCVRLNKVVAIDYTDSYQTILETVRKSGFTRYPVFKNKSIAGYINIYELFYHPEENWHSLIRPIPKVGWNQKLHGVFSRLTPKQESMAIVLKGNKIYGIITIQDIIREITTSIIKI